MNALKKHEPNSTVLILDVPRASYVWKYQLRLKYGLPIHCAGTKEIQNTSIVFILASNYKHCRNSIYGNPKTLFQLSSKQIASIVPNWKHSCNLVQSKRFLDFLLSIAELALFPRVLAHYGTDHHWEEYYIVFGMMTSRYTCLAVALTALSVFIAVEAEIQSEEHSIEEDVAIRVPVAEETGLLLFSKSIVTWCIAQGIPIRITKTRRRFRNIQHGFFRLILG